MAGEVTCIESGSECSEGCFKGCIPPTCRVVDRANGGGLWWGGGLGVYLLCVPGLRSTAEKRVWNVDLPRGDKWVKS